jgi:GTP:adenosylcobinamide-phosphate guanylyltransferase
VAEFNAPAFTAVALAGGALEADFRRAGYDVPNKAYLPIAGEFMIVRVIRALKASHTIRQIRCVTPRTAVALAPQLEQLCDELIEPGDDLIGSMLAGFSGLSDDERVVISATDMPLLTPAAVDAFTGLIAQTPCDIGYGFVERRAHDARYPGVRHTWVRLREGTFCGGGMSMIRAGAAAAIQNVLRNFASARKSPAKLASLFSPGLVFKALTGQLGIPELERRASDITNLVCRGIMCPNPEVAVNVDQLEDLRTIEAILKA